MKSGPELQDGNAANDGKQHAKHLKNRKITSEYCNHRRDILDLKERHGRAFRLPSVCDRSRNLAIKVLRASFSTKEQPQLALDDINASSLQ